jgi:hypothetical protein
MYMVDLLTKNMLPSKNILKLDKYFLSENIVSGNHLSGESHCD